MYVEKNVICNFSEEEKIFLKTWFEEEWFLGCKNSFFEYKKLKKNNTKVFELHVRKTGQHVFIRGADWEARQGGLV